jgi:gamma-glutamylcyclotransferase (GGCT)/AIG2-like uncharacterized protein YtfP
VSNFMAYGTLSLPEVMAEVTGRQLEHVLARALGFTRRRLRGRVYPAAIAEPGAWLEGRLYLDLDSATLARVDRFEGRQYERRHVAVETERGPLPAELYVLRETYRSAVLDEPWDRDVFQRDHLRDFLRMCAAFRAGEEARAADPERR